MDIRVICTHTYTLRNSAKKVVQYAEMARDLSNTCGGYGEISRVGETLGVVDPSGGGGEHQARKRVRMTPESGTEMSLPQARVPLSVDSVFLYAPCLDYLGGGHENDTFAAFSGNSLWEQESMRVLE
ncbi:hypothetical protein FQN55_006377 [Onygenales sp. PD_40]|nr:hypothetical protein FQN55_006377 [Onygenales sp. PD_40]KAK2793696.1 hypothetical protein FQN52_000648 [Onygenales sp. PD_12]KAK2804788.1 hypothetical protein FQN51_001430 [Onygenales sp. PD_10]